jgi:hypothetical protein
MLAYSCGWRQAGQSELAFSTYRLSFHPCRLFIHVVCSPCCDIFISDSLSVQSLVLPQSKRCAQLHAGARHIIVQMA